MNETFHFSCCSCFCTLHCLDSMRKLPLWSSWLEWKSHLGRCENVKPKCIYKNLPKDTVTNRSQCQETVFLPLLCFCTQCDSSLAVPHRGSSQSRWERHNPPLCPGETAAVSHLGLEWRSPCRGTRKSVRRWAGSSLCSHFPWSKNDFWLHTEMQTLSLSHWLFEETQLLWTFFKWSLKRESKALEKSSAFF